MCTDKNSTVENLDDLSPAEREQRLRHFLVCPVCGNDGNSGVGGGFRFVENIAVFRVIVGVKDGLLKINGRYETGEDDDGTDWRIECRRTKPRFCGHEFAVPAWLHEYMDWV